MWPTVWIDELLQQALPLRSAMERRDRMQDLAYTKSIDLGIKSKKPPKKADSDTTAEPYLKELARVDEVITPGITKYRKELERREKQKQREAEFEKETQNMPVLKLQLEE